MYVLPGQAHEAHLGPGPRESSQSLAVDPTSREIEQFKKEKRKTREIQTQTKITIQHRHFHLVANITVSHSQR